MATNLLHQQWLYCNTHHLGHALARTPMTIWLCNPYSDHGRRSYVVSSNIPTIVTFLVWRLKEAKYVCLGKLRGLSICCGSSEWKRHDCAKNVESCLKSDFGKTVKQVVLVFVFESLKLCFSESDLFACISWCIRKEWWFPHMVFKWS